MPRNTKAHRAETDRQLALTGAPSPYALAQLVSGRTIDWDAVPDRVALLEDIFDMPYSDLIGSAESPIFYGSTIATDGSIKRERPEVHRSQVVNDAEEEDHTPDLEGARTLADLVEAFGARDLADIPLRAATLTSDGVLAELGGLHGARDFRLQALFDLRVLDVLFPLVPGYHPPGFSWQDTGRFFNETSEFFDPVQGQVANCYFIAAMSSVAWAAPYTVEDRTRATATGQDSFTHQVSFFGDSGWQSVEVTDRVLVASGGSVSYFAHSSEAGEIWPAVYEKAYAKWRFGTSDDFPNIPDLAWGDPVGACRNLTGGRAYYNWHSGMNDTELLTLVKSHCQGGRTITPMVSWSHGAGSVEARTAVNEAGIAASHAYSLLGWMRRMEWRPRFRLDVVIPRVIPEFRLPGPGPLGPELMTGTSRAGNDHDARRLMTERTSSLNLHVVRDFLHRWELVPVDYIVLRNPWGHTPGTGASTTSGDYRARDISWWRSTPLGAGGTFALEVGAYREYFAGTGGTEAPTQ